jgi:hypothetical protein
LAELSIMVRANFTNNRLACCFILRPKTQKNITLKAAASGFFSCFGFRQALINNNKNGIKPPFFIAISLPS